MKIFDIVGKVIEKLNIFINPYLEKAAEHKQTVKIAGMATGILICSILLVTLFAPGYEVYLNGEKVAVVTDKKDFAAAFEEANERIVSLAGDGFGIARLPRYVVTVAAKTSLSAYDEMIENVMMQSDAVSKVFVISVDGTDIATAASEQSAQELIEKAASVYTGENKAILNDVEISGRYVAVTNLTDTISAVNKLTDVLEVQTENTSVYEAEIVYGTIESPTEALFINEEKVSMQGENGVMEVTAKVTMVNGMVKNTGIISSKVLKEPVDEVVMVGTTEIPSVGTGVMAQPYSGMVTSRFGARWGRTHTGTDICGTIGDPITAADNGIVTTAEYQENGYGNIIIIDHQNGIHTWYAHLNGIDVAVGDIVKKGDLIGELGDTGYVTGPHLHFEVRENGIPVNPSKYLNDLQ